VKLFIVVITALVALPLGAALGYVANQDPDPPAFAEYVTEVQGLQPASGLSSDDWQVVPTTGQYKGQAVDLLSVFQAFPTEKKLEEAAHGKVAYFEDKCSVYTPGGKSATPSVFVQRCTHIKRTRAEAESYYGRATLPKVKS